MPGLLNPDVGHVAAVFNPPVGLQNMGSTQTSIGEGLIILLDDLNGRAVQTSYEFLQVLYFPDNPVRIFSQGDGHIFAILDLPDSPLDLGSDQKPIGKALMLHLDDI